MELEFILSNASMLYQRTVLKPIEWFIGAAQDAGYTGIEFHPTRKGLCELRRSNQRWAGVRSVHQSVRDERRPWEWIRHERPVHALQAYLIFAHRSDSLAELMKVRFDGNERRLVYYPEDPATADLRNRFDCIPIFQPEPALGRRWEVYSPGDLIAGMQASGARGLCFDTHHWRRADKEYFLPNWRRAWPVLQPYVLELHVCAGRVDMGSQHIDTMTELADLLLAGGLGTELAEMLEVIAVSGWRGPVVVEVPATSIAAHLNISPWLMDPMVLMEEHAIICKTLHKIFDT